MIKRAYIQIDRNNHLQNDEKKVYDILVNRNIPITLIGKKQIINRRLPLDTTTFIVGGIDVIQSALKQLGIEPPHVPSYPDCLNISLNRKIWISTLEDVKSGLLRPLFVKPYNKLKRFTGDIINDETDFIKFQGASKKTIVYCSDIIKFSSEYRVYVTSNQIVGIEHYWGNKSMGINRDIVFEAVQKISGIKSLPNSYAIDFGVIDNGKTTLIEMNEGYSIDSYALDAESYTNLLCCRWEELMSMIV